MVAEAPERLREAAIQYFREEQLPEPLSWVDDLDSLHLRLFAVELADALKQCLLTGDYRDLTEVIEGWEATAEVMSSPEIVAALTRPLDEREYLPLSDFLDLE